MGNAYSLRLHSAPPFSALVDLPGTCGKPALVIRSVPAVGVPSMGARISTHGCAMVWLDLADPPS